MVVILQNLSVSTMCGLKFLHEIFVVQINDENKLSGKVV